MASLGGFAELDDLEGTHRPVHLKTDGAALDARSGHGSCGALRGRLLHAAGDHVIVRRRRGLDRLGHRRRGPGRARRECRVGLRLRLRRGGRRCRLSSRSRSSVGGGRKNLHDDAVAPRGDLVTGGGVESDDHTADGGALILVLGRGDGRHAALVDADRGGDGRDVAARHIDDKARGLLELEDRVARGAGAADVHLDPPGTLGHVDATDDVRARLCCRGAARSRGRREEGRQGQAGEDLGMVAHLTTPRGSATGPWATGSRSGSSHGSRRP